MHGTWANQELVADARFTGESKMDQTRKYILWGIIALVVIVLAAWWWSARAQAQLVNQPTATNCSGTVVTASTAVTPIAAQKAQHGFYLQNMDSTQEGLWWSVTGVAAVGATGSFVLAAGTATNWQNAGSVTFLSPAFPTGGALSVVALTAGHKFSCLYW